MQSLYLFRIIIASIFVLSQSSAFCQTISRHILGSLGDVKRSAEFHLSYTLGEAVSVSRTLPQGSWNIGFQQGYLTESTAVSPIIYEDLAFSLHPNPVARGNSVVLTSNKEDIVYDILFVLDYNGRVIQTIKNPSFPFSFTVPAFASAGVYQIVLSNTSGGSSAIPFVVMQ